MLVPKCPLFRGSTIHNVMLMNFSVSSALQILVFSLQDVHLVDYLSVESHYVSLFHPISLLRKEVVNFLSKILHTMELL